MKVCFLSYGAFGIDLAWLLKEEGHSIDVYVVNLHGIDTGKGLIEINVWDSEKVDCSNYDLVIIDDVYFGKFASDLRRRGIKVIGGSVDTDVWENNRKVGVGVMEGVGIKVPKSWEFDDYDRAIEFLSNEKRKDSERLFVLKYSGAESLEKGKTVVGTVIDEIIWYLNRFKDQSDGKYKPHIVLQERVRGIEVAMGAWFNGKRFIGDLNYNFEHKRMFAGELGPLCGEAGTLVVFSKDWRLFYEKGLGRCEELLRKVGYVGYIDLNCILTEEGELYGLEFTPRFGWPLFQIIARQWKFGKIGEMLIKIAGGEEVRGIVDDSVRYGVGICVFVPMNYGEVPVFVDREVGQNVEDVVREWLGLDDCKYDREKECFISVIGSGSSWYGRMLVVVGKGDSVDVAIADGLSKAKKLKSTVMWYRPDIGMRYYREKDLLKQFISDV